MKKKIIAGMLKLVAHLPLPVLYAISDFIYFVVYHVIGYRRKVVVKNLTESFPLKNAKEIAKIEKGFYHFLGDVMVETVKLFNISPDEMSRRVEVFDAEEVNNSLRNGRNAVLLMGHYCNWEWAQEITRYFLPGSFQASIYHPLNNKMWDEIFLSLRSRWGAHIVPQKKAPRILLDRDHFPWVCGFIADHRPAYGAHTNTLQFLHHDTDFIYGPEEIGEKVGADFFYLEMLRPKRGYYTIRFKKLEKTGEDKPFPYTRAFWHEFEQTIKAAPAFWLWSHKRWKK